MTATTNPRILVPIGIIACMLSFPILFIGALSTGGGHGSYALWYATVVFASAAGLFLLFGTGVALKKKRSWESILGAVVLVFYGIVALRFWEIAEWVADRVFE